MRYNALLAVTVAGSLFVLPTIAVEKQITVPNVPRSINTATTPMMNNQAIETARANQQIADLRQQVAALQQSMGRLQQELANFRTEYARHNHSILGSAAPVADVVRRPDAYPGLRLWVGSGLPETTGPRSR